MARTKFEKIRKKLSEDEINKHNILSINGFVDWSNNTVYMGTKQYEMLKSFEVKMVEKYIN